MSHRVRFQVPHQAAPATYAHVAHARAYPTAGQPVVQTYTQRLQAEERRRTEAAEIEAQRLMRVYEIRTQVDTQLRAASDRRTAERKAKQEEKHSVKQSKIAEREATAEWWAGIREYYRDKLTPEALKLARAQYRARKKAAQLANGGNSCGEAGCT